MTLAPRQLSLLEAQELTTLIRETTEALWELLLTAYEGQAHKAMGYDRWEDYVKAEFDMSRSRSYQIIDQGRVIRELQDAANMSTIVDTTKAPIQLNEYEARRIKPHLVNAVAEVREAMAEGVEPQQAVANVIQKYGPVSPKQADTIARETGYYVAGTDGYFHDGRPPGTDEAIERDQKKLYGFFDALETLAKLDPEDMVRSVPSYQTYHVDDHLENALINLKTFKQCWVKE